MTPQLPHRDETTSAAPDVSPGPVRNYEQLVRALFNPDHVVDGTLLDRAISLRDLRQSGLSIHRLRHTEPDVVRRVNDKILSRTFEGQTRTLEGVAKFLAHTVRGIRKDGSQVFVVIDTAVPCNAGHASIYAVDGTAKDSYLRELRSLLLPLLQERISLERAFKDQ